MKVTGRSLAEAEVNLFHDEVDELIAPEKEFVLLADWVAETRRTLEQEGKLQSSDPDPRPEDAQLKVQRRKFRGKVYIGVVVLTGQKRPFQNP
jgi:hypothetical protein